MMKTAGLAKYKKEYENSREEMNKTATMGSDYFKKVN